MGAYAIGGPRFCTLPKATGTGSAEFRATVLVSVAKIDTGGLKVTSATILLVTAGATRYGHLSGSERNPSIPAMPMQWCCPPTRQHASTEAELACTVGADKPVSKTISAAMETPRLMSSRILAHHALV